MNRNAVELLALFGCLITLSVLSLFVGRNIGKANMREEAIKHGVAEWVVVDDAGSTEFRWKPEPK